MQVCLFVDLSTLSFRFYAGIIRQPLPPDLQIPFQHMPNHIYTPFVSQLLQPSPPPLPLMNGESPISVEEDSS